MSGRVLGLACCAFLLVFGALESALARERLAVFMSVDDDAALADNLTAVAISKLAEMRRFELVGSRELASGLNELVGSAGLNACLSRPNCLAEVGVRAGVTRALIGDVRREGDNFTLRLTLTATGSSAIEGQVGRSASASVEGLIAAVQSGVGELFPAPPAPNAALAPTAKSTLEQPVSADAVPSARPESRGARSRSAVLPYLAYGSAATAVVAFSVAALTGTVARGAATGHTRAEAQSDIGRRKDYASAANALFVAGGAFSAISVVAFVW